MRADIVRKAPYIVIDGLDGCGKGTQLKLLSDRIEHEGKKFMLTREPGGAPLSEALRELFKSDIGSKASALTQFLMMWASRRNYLEEAVWPSLEKGIPVLSDRGDSSTFAYQVIGKNPTMPLDGVFWRMRPTVFSSWPPTLYIFLKVPPYEARRRVFGDNTRGEVSHFDASSLAFYERVDCGFEIFGKNPKVKMILVDGTRSREAVHEDIYRIVSEECGW